MDFVEFLKVIVLGIVEGITEWLPVSSTGHMYLLDEFWPLSMSEDFKEMFFVVIQLGAILAVIVVFWKRLWPFGWENVCEEKEPAGASLHSDADDGASSGSNVTCKMRGRVYAKKDILILWLKVIVACLPAAVLGLLFDDLLDEYLYNGVVIALMLILYGIAFILVENWNRKRTPRINTVEEIDYRTAFLIGLFQVLALIPGTSRSGATIVGALLIGVSRTAAAEFTFFLAIPTMFGASLLKLVKFFLEGNALGGTEVAVLLLGMAVAFAVSIIVIKFLMGFVKKHDFKVFGWYRIVLGIIVLTVFLLQFLEII